MWLVGALIAACGTAVYIELGTVSISCFPYIWLIMKWRAFQEAAERKTISNLFTVNQSSWLHVQSWRIPSWWYFYSVDRLCHLSNTFRARPQRTALYLANVGCSITVVSCYFNSCRSSSFIVHWTDLVPYSSGCLLLPVLYLSCPWNSTQMGRPSSKRVRIIQARRPWSDFCLWPPVSGGVQTRAGPWRVWKTWQL